MRCEASKTDLIVTRAQAAADRLRACGVTAPLKVTADNSLNRTRMGWFHHTGAVLHAGRVYLFVLCRRPPYYQEVAYSVISRLTAAYLRAATFFGSAEKIRSEMHYELAGPARQRAEVALAVVRAALDPALCAEALAAGQQLSLEDSFAMILTPGSTTGVPLA